MKQKCINLDGSHCEHARMAIYLSNLGCTPKHIPTAIKYDCYDMVSPKYYINKHHTKWALDNGAFTGFDEELFYKVLEKSKIHNPDFVVIPDVVGKYKESLELSSIHIDNIDQIKYFVIRDGMTFDMVKPFISKVDGLFVGGSIDWKYREAEKWVKFAHKNNLPCHIGRVGTIAGYTRASGIGADSVDGSNPTRNDRMDIIKTWRDIEKEQRGFHDYKDYRWENLQKSVIPND